MNTFECKCKYSTWIKQHSLSVCLHNLQIKICIMNLRSIHRRCSVRKGVSRNFTKFTGKHPYQSLFFNKVTGLRPLLHPDNCLNLIHICIFVQPDVHKCIFINPFLLNIDYLKLYT